MAARGSGQAANYNCVMRYMVDAAHAGDPWAIGYTARDFAVVPNATKSIAAGIRIREAVEMCRVWEPLPIGRMRSVVVSG